jgi:adenylate cyclase
MTYERTEQSSSRRLAAIMFTDMVGYTALSQSNEEQALKILARHNKLLRPFFPRFKGREVKTIGDSFLVEFESALDATRCAIEIQEFLHDYNFSSREDWKINLRIGIHLGDVVHLDSDIFGDAVNIASRIESLADPEGICISEQVFDQIRNKLDFPLEELKNVELKNIKIPLAMYKVILPWEKAGGGGSDGKTVAAAAASSASQTTDKRRIAVLPFANMSSEPENAYFADGMTEELIATMSKISGLQVIARTSVMRYKRQEEKSIDQIARELQVGSIMEGSVRRVGDRLRITVQLIDSNTNDHLWAESYDRRFEDAFSIQSDISNRVAEALKVKLQVAEKKDIDRGGTANPGAHTLYLKGRYLWNERTKAGVNKAMKYFEEAIRLDPAYAEAYAGLADCYTVSSDYSWMKPNEAMPKAKQYALKALDINPEIAEAHAVLALSYNVYDWRWHEAEKEFLRSIELKPSYATAYHWYSHLLRASGRTSEAYEKIKRASELDPMSRVIGVNLGETLLLMGRLKEGIEQMEKVKEGYPDYSFVRAFLGYAYYLDSRNEEAIREVRGAIEVSGGYLTYRIWLAHLLGLAGRQEEAKKVIEELEQVSKTEYIDKGHLAIAHYTLGNTDKAFELLEKAYEERSDSFLYIMTFPWYAEFRKDPRWHSFEERLGIRKTLV